MHQKIALAHIIVCREHHHLPGPKRTPRGGFFGPLFASASLLDDDGVHCRGSSVNAVPTTQATPRTPSPISRCPSVFLKNVGLLKCSSSLIVWKIFDKIKIFQLICDVDYEDDAEEWIEDVISILSSNQD